MSANAGLCRQMGILGTSWEECCLESTNVLISASAPLAANNTCIRTGHGPVYLRWFIRSLMRIQLWNYKCATNSIVWAASIIIIIIVYIMLISLYMYIIVDCTSYVRVTDYGVIMCIVIGTKSSNHCMPLSIARILSLVSPTAPLMMNIKSHRAFNNGY